MSVAATLTTLITVMLIVMAGLATIAFMIGRERGRDDMRQEIEEESRQAQNDE